MVSSLALAEEDSPPQVPGYGWQASPDNYSVFTPKSLKTAE
jgi:hypothetical protein